MGAGIGLVSCRKTLSLFFNGPSKTVRTKSHQVVTRAIAAERQEWSADSGQNLISLCWWNYVPDRYYLLDMNLICSRHKLHPIAIIHDPRI